MLKRQVGFIVSLLALVLAFAQPARAEDDHLWGALAAGLTTTRVAVGSAIKFATKAEAEAGALKACREQGVPGCKVVDTFTGCGYITTGTNQSARRVGWGSGPSPAAATASCRKRGLSCNKEPKGGCNTVANRSGGGLSEKPNGLTEKGGGLKEVPSSSPSTNSHDLAGKYSMTGTNPNGSTYHGAVTITRDGDFYEFRWRISNGDTFHGKGRLRGSTISVDWGQKYPVIYEVDSGGKLHGTWSDGKASEDLVPE
jgi:hypothetical protein